MCLVRCWIFVLLVIGDLVTLGMKCFAQSETAPTWARVDQLTPTLTSKWSLHTRIPMTMSSTFVNKNSESSRKRGSFKGGKLKHKKKYRKFLLPLLMAYKLKFFTLIPVLIGGLLLLTGSTGLAGFFFALFAATMGLRTKHH